MIFLGLALGLYVNIQAQPEGRGEHPRKEARAEVQTYFESNVIPVIREQRAKLDEVLSAEEQETLFSVRVELDELRKEEKEKREAMRKAFKEARESGERPQRPEPTEEEKMERREKSKQMRGLMNQVWEIIDSHEEQVYALLDELKENRSTWHEDISAIMQKYRPGKSGEKEGMKEGKGRRAKGMRPGSGGEGGRMRRGPGGDPIRGMMQPVGFMLFNAEEVLEDEAFKEMISFPNPTSSSTTLKYELKNSGNVKIDLLDREGNLIRTLWEGQNEAGDYERQFDIGELNSGIYLFRVQSAEGVQTQKIIKQ